MHLVTGHRASLVAYHASHADSDLATLAASTAEHDGTPNEAVALCSMNIASNFWILLQLHFVGGLTVRVSTR